MGKPRAIPKAKKPQQKAPVYNTVDDYQDAADLEETTGGKWRAGDKAKSGRAFLRAVDIYNSGLAKFPKSFDLAYNKACLQLELSQQPGIVAHLPMPLIELLDQALNSHRYALSLDEQNADLLFNNAQVYSALAAELADSRSVQEGYKSDPGSLLKEALRQLDQCFRLQKDLLRSQEVPYSTNPSDNTAESSETDLDRGMSNHEEEAAEEQRVYIQQPVTASDLIDTATTTLEVLRRSVQFENAENFSRLESMANALVNETIPECLAEMSEEKQGPVRAKAQLEAVLFSAEMASAVYTRIDGNHAAYRDKLNAFQTLDLVNDFAAICSYADSLFEFVSVVLRTESSSPSDMGHTDLLKRLASTLWSTLALVQTHYSRASKLNSFELTAERKAEIYRARGNADFVRHRICHENALDDPQTAGQAPQLIKNAMTFYKAASDQFKMIGEQRAAERANVQRLIACIVATHHEKDKYKQELAGKLQLAEIVIKEMIEDGCLGAGWTP